MSESELQLLEELEEPTTEEKLEKCERELARYTGGAHPPTVPARQQRVMPPPQKLDPLDQAALDRFRQSATREREEDRRRHISRSLPSVPKGRPGLSLTALQRRLTELYPEGSHAWPAARSSLRGGKRRKRSRRSRKGCIRKYHTRRVKRARRRRHSQRR